jgi:DHA2 family multidrug resistance protein-like MFS transporter
LWIVDIYGFLVAGFLITMGSIGDRIGRRRLLLIGAGAFGVASVLAAFSSSAIELIVMRAALGVAGATLAPSTLSLIRNMFLDPKERTFAIGVWVTSYSVGAAIGPLLGGLLLQHFHWGSVFLVGVPVMVLLLALGPRLLPEYRAADAGPLDWPSVLLSLSSVLAVVYGAKHLAERGPDAAAALITGAGVLLGVLFLRRQRTLTHPLVDLQLFRSPALGASLLTYLLATFVAFGTFVFIGQYLQLVLGFSPAMAGLHTVPWALGFIAGSLLSPALVRRARPAVVVSAGLVLAAAGFALLVELDASSGAALVVLASLVLSLGLAPVFTLATDLIVGAAPPERAGAASALSETSSELGGALGIAIWGSIGAAVYRSRIRSLLPQGLAPDVAAELEGTLGAALSAAETLTEPLAAAASCAAREAFTHALRFTGALSAFVLVAGALFAFSRVEKPAQRAAARGSIGRASEIAH